MENIKDIKKVIEAITKKDVEWEIGKTYKAYCIKTGALVAEYNPAKGTLEVWK